MTRLDYYLTDNSAAEADDAAYERALDILGDAIEDCGNDQMQLAQLLGLDIGRELGPRHLGRGREHPLRPLQQLDIGRHARRSLEFVIDHETDFVVVTDGVSFAEVDDWSAGHDLCGRG